MTTYQNALRMARKRAGLSVEEVAVRIRAFPARIERWECGEEKPDAATLFDLAALYQVAPHRLLAETAAPCPEADFPADATFPALDAFRRELTAMRELDLLPLDDETIEYCVVKMRARLVSEKTQNN